MTAIAPADLHHQIGLTLFERGRYRASLESHRLATEIDPDHADAHFRSGVLLWFQRDLDGALRHLDRAIELRPSHAMSRSFQGIALYSLGALDRALDACDRAIAIDPLAVDGHVFRGLVLHALDRDGEAGAAYGRALELDPLCAPAHVFLGELFLADGAYARGWKECEWRFRSPWWPATKIDAPRWDGSPLAGRRLLLHAEQGYGDTIQHSRFALELIDRGDDVFFEVQNALVPLFRTVPRLGRRLVARGDPRPPVDLHAAIGSMPHLLALDSVPPFRKYLSAVPRALPRETFNVGVAWQGSPTHCLDRHRSVPLRSLLVLARPGVRLWSLQHGFGTEQIEPGMPLEAAPPEFGFDAAASAIAGLDLVVTVDSVVAHLAGALGVPTWVLLPHVADARWLRDREDTPWYPSVRLIRSDAPFAWNRTIEAARALLNEEIEKHEAEQMKGR